MPFDKYKTIGGYSHSFLKREVGGISPEFIQTEKVLLGSLVDSILMQPEDADISSPLWPQAVKIASAIKASFGSLISQFKSQRSYVATASYSGLSLRVTGRTDWEIDGHAIIDLKVTGCKTDGQFAALIKQMGYDNQQWNYSKMAGVKKAYLMPFSTAINKPLSVISLDCSCDFNQFWADKILKFGE
jgi:hypothetical protein